MMSRRFKATSRLCVSLAVLLIVHSASKPAIDAGETQEKDRPVPKWIWADAQAKTQAPSEPLVFHREFEVEGDPVRSQALITCDNRFEMVINGKLVGRGDDWQQPRRFDLKGFVQQGRNRISIRAKNDDEGPAGLIMLFNIFVDGGKDQILITDGEWRVTPDTATNDIWWGDLAQGKAAAELGVLKETEPWKGQVNWSEPVDVKVIRTRRVAQSSFEFLDGDRVTWLGGTWVERQQAYNYFETLVTAAYPDRDIRFRNLGWSGDDVTGIARAVFGSQEDGFKRLRDDLLRTAPNVIIVNYGGNEAFKGPQGEPEFEAGFNRLATLLDSTGAKIIVIGPHYLEELGAPLPAPQAINQQIDRYNALLLKLCEAHDYDFIDYRKPLGDETVSKSAVPDIRDRLTDNGLHFNAYGYWRSALHLAARLNVPTMPWSITLSAGDASREMEGGTLSEVRFDESRISFTANDRHLPYPTAPDETPRGGKMLGPKATIKVLGLPEGKYGLNVDGQPSVMASHEQWANGVVIDRGHYVKQVEDLRSAIHKKNELYFHRYRPQNETYLFLFRKHEQGNNAVEVPQFDGLVEAEEKRIRELRQPQPVQFELIRIQQ